MADGSERSEALVAGAGALVVGFILYVLIAGLGGGIDLDDILTFDQRGRLELEGVILMLGLDAGAVVGAPLGAYLALRRRGARAAGGTALLTVLTCGAATFLIMWIVPSAPKDPVLQPYGVFGAWFLAPALTRLAVERGLTRGPSEPAP